MNQVMYADVLLPLPLDSTFTYAVGDEWLADLQTGRAVIVPFGARKLVTGIVTALHSRRPETHTVKQIVAVLGAAPIVNEKHLQFWKWIASYYLCTEGEVMKAALPAGLKLESETVVVRTDVSETGLPLKERELNVLDALPPGREMPLQALGKLCGIASILPLVQQLMEKGLVVVSEDIRTSYRTKKRTYVRLTAAYRTDPDALNQALDNLSRARKQAALLLKYRDLAAPLDKGETAGEVEKSVLLEQAGASAALLKALCTSDILECVEKAVNEVSERKTGPAGVALLNAHQQAALDAIHQQFDKQAVCLLHGVTSSGKTEIYMHLIQECLDAGKQVLYLVPEIALTTQLSSRLERVFGEALGVYHSGMTDAERVAIWHQVQQSNGLKVILGARSSVFLPFHSLGLVIVDEEHDSSYKQQEPAPRYNARNAAMVLAARFGAKTLLGTATPSVESYANCLMGKSGLVELSCRYADAQLPDIVAVDTKELKRKKRMKSFFSPVLLDYIQAALEAGEQVILFQNRRGYAPMLECKVCGWIPKCSHCDVSLTYHKYRHQLSCHYCGFETDVPSRCPSCGEPGLTTGGFGTEQVEEEVHRLFPEARTSRLDTDTTRGRHSFEQILQQFGEGKMDVLIGTQMVSKGLDFSRVKVVGILNADQMMGFPDFRAQERAFQLMAQVSGRAGRSGRKGVVVIQTSHPDNPVIKHVISNDYTAFFNEETSLRQLFDYPPYTRIIQLLFKHVDAIVVRRAALLFASLGEKVFAHRLLGPDQ
ncbi:MAG: primosomal protein N', partial [Bacteroidota bacterium]|nr:primosomal protein N' [Bacteroidota bacterium]